MEIPREIKDFLAEQQIANLCRHQTCTIKTRMEYCRVHNRPHCIYTNCSRLATAKSKVYCAHHIPEQMEKNKQRAQNNRLQQKIEPKLPTPTPKNSPKKKEPEEPLSKRQQKQEQEKLTKKQTKKKVYSESESETTTESSSD